MEPHRYTHFLDEEERVVTFLLHNWNGSIVGYQQYRPDRDSKKNNDPKEGRYFTYLPRGVDGFFGIEQIDPTDRTIYVVEGVFKAAVLHRLGYNSISALSSSPKRLKPWFKIMRQTWDLVAIGDNDSAGKLLVNCVKKGFQSPKDLDEMKDDEVRSIINEALVNYDN